jgi:hypothetical protein
MCLWVYEIDSCPGRRRVTLVIVQQFARCSMRYAADGLLVVLRTKEPV